MYVYDVVLSYKLCSKFENMFYMRQASHSRGKYKRRRSLLCIGSFAGNTIASPSNSLFYLRERWDAERIAMQWWKVARIFSSLPRSFSALHQLVCVVVSHVWSLPDIFMVSGRQQNDKIIRFIRSNVWLYFGRPDAAPFSSWSYRSLGFSFFIPASPLMFSWFYR